MSKVVVDDEVQGDAHNGRPICINSGLPEPNGCPGNKVRYAVNGRLICSACHSRDEKRDDRIAKREESLRKKLLEEHIKTLENAKVRKRNWDNFAEKIEVMEKEQETSELGESLSRTKVEEMIKSSSRLSSMMTSRKGSPFNTGKSSPSNIGKKSTTSDQNLKDKLAGVSLNNSMDSNSSNEKDIDDKYRKHYFDEFQKEVQRLAEQTKQRDAQLLEQMNQKRNEELKNLEIQRCQREAQFIEQINQKRNEELKNLEIQARQREDEIRETVKRDVYNQCLKQLNEERQKMEKAIEEEIRKRSEIEQLLQINQRLGKEKENYQVPASPMHTIVSTSDGEVLLSQEQIDQMNKEYWENDAPNVTAPN